MSSASQRNRPRPGAGKIRDGRTEIRQRLTLAVGCPKSQASVCRRHRRRAKPTVLEVSGPIAGGARR